MNTGTYISYLFCTDGTDCPMALYWPTNSTRPRDGDSNYFRLNDFCNLTCVQEMGLERQTSDMTTCPDNFYWKGVQ